MAATQVVNKPATGTGWPTRRNSGTDIMDTKPTLHKGNSITINRTINL